MDDGRETRVEVADGTGLALDVWDGLAAPPFLLVHGLASNARMWTGVGRRLAAAGHPAAAVDQRGHGRSDAPDHGYDLATAVGDLRQVMHRLGGEHPGFGSPPVVAGQSWGATVVLELARRHGDEVAGVVLVDGGTMELQHRFPQWEQCLAALTPPPTAGTRRSDLEAMMRRMHPDWPEEGIEGALANFDVRPDGTVAPHLSLDHHLSLLRALWEFSPTAAYPEVEVPVLIVPAAGGRGPFSNEKAESVRAALEALPRARAEWFDPADHDLHAQHPQRLADLLLSETKGGLFA